MALLLELSFSQFFLQFPILIPSIMNRKPHSVWLKDMGWWQYPKMT